MKASINASTARLLITCPDKAGIVSAVSNFLYNHGANITALDQYSTAPEGGTYFMRLEFQTPHLDLSKQVLAQTFEEAVAKRYNMTWQLSYADDVKKMAVLVSKYDHALLELLWRWSRGGLPCQITAVISNHADLQESVERFNVPFHVVQVTKDNKQEAEAQIQALLKDNDLVVLARYMQILSAEFVSQWPHKIINIHHSFLPAFVGANPYQQAYDKGVKLIGATAHYVTADLDQGPIIEQAVERVSHGDNVETLRELGEDVERNVLARAVRWHLEDRVIVHGNKTIVFA
ncbi:MAG TPA: formyltetrahydrofolate deformylase [Agitococcus sp.]|uniref:formyltetrahydrofolate deformylase n=1 Tax=uncultured Agitococcus sp. TaxID=1506599 RepID=UPI002615DFF8|nr:formyltetrahydrofolate deformylase [uncultured Agitococcus sp.]HRH91042.1 formyltetrahydrofolate deformylase [Agitococcus sp.]